MREQNTLSKNKPQTTEIRLVFRRVFLVPRLEKCGGEKRKETGCKNTPLIHFSIMFTNRCYCSATQNIRASNLQRQDVINTLRTGDADLRF